MMVFSIDNLQIGEIRLLRQALDVIQITGKDAQYVANLQLKLESEMKQIEEFIKTEELKKAEGIEKIEKANKPK
jgi:hypothetical protein